METTSRTKTIGRDAVRALCRNAEDIFNLLPGNQFVSKGRWGPTASLRECPAAERKVSIQSILKFNRLSENLAPLIFQVEL